MALETGTLVYRIHLSRHSSGLFQEITVERYEVLEVLPDSVVVWRYSSCEFPDHSPPLSWNWSATNEETRVFAKRDFNDSPVGWTTNFPDFGTYEEIDETAVERDYLDWKNRQFVAREMGLSKPLIGEEQRRLFYIHEYRFGLLAL